MAYTKTKVFLGQDELDRIEITKYPERHQILIQRREEKAMNRKQALDSELDATEKCIQMICERDNVHRSHFEKKNGTSVYCPLHEKVGISRSKSGQIFHIDNTYICYSSNCPIKRNRNGYRIISTLRLLEYIKYAKCSV